VAKRKGENFGRIKGATLAKFISEVHNEESVFGLIENDDTNKENLDVMSSRGSEAPSQAESVTSCVTYTTEMLGVTQATKFILLDLREEEEYKAYHIKEAISFPAPNISRDKVFSHLLKFKNIPDKIIVVYMSDERSGSHYAKLLHEKGFDNVFLLSGGIEKFLVEHRDQVDGTQIPPPPKPTKKQTMSIMKGTATSGFKSTARH